MQTRPFSNLDELRNASDRERKKLASRFLKLHRQSFHRAHEYAESTGHDTPSDTASWSEILASILHGVPGLERKKGPDLDDGSDVKAANTWKAIDTPRFNGVAKAGTQSELSGGISYFDEEPYLFFVLWDNEPQDNNNRCRVWCVRPDTDPEFRSMCEDWYEARRNGDIESDNFQLHPPRGTDSNVIRSSFSYLEYPLVLRSDWSPEDKNYTFRKFDLDVIYSGLCTPAD